MEFKSRCAGVPLRRSVAHPLATERGRATGRVATTSRVAGRGLTREVSMSDFCVSQIDELERADQVNCPAVDQKYSSGAHRSSSRTCLKTASAPRSAAGGLQPAAEHQPARPTDWSSGIRGSHAGAPAQVVLRWRMSSTRSSSFQGGGCRDQGAKARRLRLRADFVRHRHPQQLRQRIMREVAPSCATAFSASGGSSALVGRSSLVWPFGAAWLSGFRHEEQRVSGGSSSAPAHVRRLGGGRRGNLCLDHRKTW